MASPLIQLESYIRAHDEDGIATVEYSMVPEVARAVAQVLDAEAVRTNDDGYRQDALALFAAADEADAL